jgi:hypothetical protein
LHGIVASLGGSLVGDVLDGCPSMDEVKKTIEALCVKAMEV